MTRIHVVALLSAIILLLYVLELVRRRRLQEQYSWLWLLLAIGCFLVVVWPRLTVWVAQSVGSRNPLTALVFLALYCLVLILIQLSTRLSRLTTQNKDLAQLVAILDSELRRLSNAMSGEGNPDQSVEERKDAQRADDRSGGLVPGLDEHRPAG
jgi:hypothetical protein